MSEYINNASNRKDQLKAIIRKLHAGQSVESLRQEFGGIIEDTSAADIAAAEREVIEEGLPVSEIQKLCDLHVAVFQDGLESKPEPESLPGHPVFAMRLENEVIGRVLEALVNQLNEAELGRQGAWDGLRKAASNLPVVVDHYNFKENLLFPYLEKKGFEGPSKVMWGVHNDIRAEIKNLQALLADEIPDLVSVENVLEHLVQNVREMMYKEEKILIPESLSLLSDQEWQAIAASKEDATPRAPQAPKHQPVPVAQTPASTPAPAPIVTPGRVGAIGLNTGALTAEQIDLMLSHLPVDVTFVDENDEVRYFSQTRDRVFTRTPAIIGRTVLNCHPPQSVHVVQAILDDFKSGRRDNADFWISMGPKFVYIRYFALRDAQGNYRGTLEVTQDVADIRGLQGERRILDDAKPA
ncbi:MAG TPA: DUF438 domain-containing protein [Anaerolineaceae bacterium]|nr:DUF438 domain-containing protein [Anaerolineaceae bacterium]HPT23614.1 DUF438 domain-containing protein [Anaerolineaceae bacterium]